MSEHERKDHSPVVSRVGQSEWEPAGDSLEGPSIINSIFLEEGNGPHFS